MSDLGWGAGGAQEALTDQLAKNADARAQGLYTLSMEEGAIKVQEAKQVLAKQDAITKMMNSYTQQKKDAADPSKPPLPGDDYGQAYNAAQDMNAMGRIAMAAGAPEEAQSYYASASSLIKNTDEIHSHMFEQQEKKLKTFSSLMEGVTDQQSWLQANSIYQITTGEKSPYANMPYKPEFVAELKASISTAQERLAQSQAGLKAAKLKAETTEVEARTSLMRAQEKITRDRDALLGKSGGKPPTASDMKGIADMIKDTYGDSVTPAHAQVLARPIAEAAKKIANDQHVDMSTAMNIAYQQADRNGVFKGLQFATKDLGSTPDRARPFTNEMSKKDLKANQYYSVKLKDYTGPALWTGKGWEYPDLNKDETPPEEPHNSDGDE